MRIGNARTIADIEFVIGAPSPGSNISSWIARGASCTRDIHRFVGQSYSFYIEVLQLAHAAPRKSWRIAIIKESWRYPNATNEGTTTKSLKVIEGKAADVLSWMRRHREEALITEPSRNKTAIPIVASADHDT